MSLHMGACLQDETEHAESIANPQLPHVASFLERFPYYLDTVVHCARKTEVRGCGTATEHNPTQLHLPHHHVARLPFHLDAVVCASGGAG